MSRLAAVSAVLAALALAACGSSQTASVPTTSGAKAPGTNAATAGPSRSPCARLELAWTGTQGATGHLEITLSLRNASGRGCILRGYPRARLLDAAGHTLPLRVHRGGGFFPDSQGRPHTVSLRPGAVARFGLSFVVNNEYAGARTCRPAATMMSLAPDTSRWQRISLAGAGRPRVVPCGDRVVVSPVYS